MNTSSFIRLAYHAAIAFNDVIMSTKAEEAMSEHEAFASQYGKQIKLAQMMNLGLVDLNAAQHQMPQWRDISFMLTVPILMGPRVILKIPHHKEPVSLLMQVGPHKENTIRLTLDRLMLRDDMVRGFQVEPMFNMTHLGNGQFETDYLVGSAREGRKELWADLSKALDSMPKNTRFDLRTQKEMAHVLALLSDEQNYQGP